MELVIGSEVIRLDRVAGRNLQQLERSAWLHLVADLDPRRELHLVRVHRVIDRGHVPHIGDALFSERREHGGKDARERLRQLLCRGIRVHHRDAARW